MLTGMLAGLLLTSAVTSGAEPSYTISTEPLEAYDRRFFNTSGWIGADGAYSVRLDEHRTLWLFSDTFVGEVRYGRRTDCTMINNSIAIQQLGPGGGMEFYYPTGADGTPQSFVRPANGDGYFWLFGAAMTPRGLYLFLHSVENTGAGGAFGFRGTGASIGHIADVSQPVQEWQVTQRRLPFARVDESGSISFGSAVMVDSGWVYVYGTDSRRGDGGDRRSAMVLARAPIGDLGDFDSWRFHSGGEWRRDFTACDDLCDEMASEFSVSYLPGIRRYVLVYTLGGMFGKIMLRTAPRPEGPWSAPVEIYDCPDKTWHQKAFSYAAKAHPELAQSPSELVITYATNSFEFSDLIEDSRLYWPRFVRAVVTESSP